MFFRILERGFVVILFFFLMGAATSILYADEDADAYLALQGSLHGPIAAIQATLSLVAAFLILTRWRRVAGAALIAWPLLLLAAVQLLSTAWSINPMLTLRKVVLEFIMLSMGFYLGERYSTDDMAKMLAKILCLTMGIVVILAVVMPRMVIEADKHPALKGLSQNKNGFGFYIGLTAAILLIVRFKQYDWLRYLCLPVAFGMLLFSRSMTSVGAAAAIIITLPLWLIARLPIKQRVVGYIAVFATLGVSVCCAMLYSGFLLSLVGKDATLTGRTQVWQQLLFAIRHHPLLGYGYGAFWTGLRGESLDVLVTSGWIVPSAHNAYLELWLAMGIPGIAVTIVIFWSAIRKAIKYIRTERGWPGLWPIACILFILVHGLGESEFIFDSSFACCLFTALYTSLALKSPRYRRNLAPVRTPTRAALSTRLPAW